MGPWAHGLAEITMHFAGPEHFMIFGQTHDKSLNMSGRRGITVWAPAYGVDDAKTQAAQSTQNKNDKRFFLGALVILGGVHPKEECAPLFFVTRWRHTEPSDGVNFS